MKREDREENESIFLRSELLLGRSGMERLKNSSVAVFGLGGVGGHCAEALARSGVGRLILVDSDRVSETNLNRQCVAFRSTIGQMKTKVMEQIIKEICPDTEVMTFETFVLPDNVEKIFEKAGPVDYIVDAIDTVTAKLALADWAAEHGVSMISSMGTGNKLHPERFRLADIEDTAVCPLCRVMRRELKKRGIRGLRVLYSEETPVQPDPVLEQEILVEEQASGSGRRSIPGSVSFVPPAAGFMIAGGVVRDLTFGTETAKMKKTT